MPAVASSQSNIILNDMVNMSAFEHWRSRNKVVIVNNSEELELKGQLMLMFLYDCLPFTEKETGIQTSTDEKNEPWDKRVYGVRMAQYTHDIYYGDVQVKIQRKLFADGPGEWSEFVVKVPRHGGLFEERRWYSWRYNNLDMNGFFKTALGDFAWEYSKPAISRGYYDMPWWPFDDTNPPP